MMTRGGQYKADLLAGAADSTRHVKDGAAKNIRR
jgi:hypothetical protein